VFGEHALTAQQVLMLLVVSILRLAGYGLHAMRTRFPLLGLGRFRIRTFRAAVSRNFFNRLGIEGIPFILPLLYQVGIGFSPVQSGLLMIPGDFRHELKTTMPRTLGRFGYRAGLISNTVILGLLILVFATIRPGTPMSFLFCSRCASDSSACCKIPV
jgi:hypothetical protein